MKSIYLAILSLVVIALGAWVCVTDAMAKPNACPYWAHEFINNNADRYDEYIDNAQGYIDDVLDILDEEHVDRVWVWLMLLESGGKLNRRSSAGAIGVWQLMPATSKHYGCDNPNDIPCATHAAARYIKKLLVDFHGDKWQTIAAYNMGGANYRKYGPTQAARTWANLISCLMIHRDIDAVLREAGDLSANDGEIFIRDNSLPMQNN